MQPLPYILMLEDDPDDRYITNSIVEEAGIDIPIVFLSNTNDLFPALEKNIPVLILMDYNLHPENGFEVLKKLKANTTFNHIPVVILGDTDEARFTSECYRLGANSYIVKPSSIELSKKKINLFFKYWFEVAALGKAGVVSKQPFS